MRSLPVCREGCPKDRVGQKASKITAKKRKYDQGSDEREVFQPLYGKCTTPDNAHGIF